MASIPNQLPLPNPSQPQGKPKKKKIDIPYNRWPNRLRRALISFIKITLFLSVVTILAIFASGGDVELQIVLGTTIGAATYVISLLANIFPILLMYGVLLWFLGRPKVEVIRPGDDTTVTFDDYWGQPQLVKLVKQWMSLLRDRKDFEKMGGKYISGLLLFGPPGTGKTMLAKAIAGESGMAFISAEGSGFMGTFVGTDVIKVLQFAGKARKLARQYGACVAYIDEIDAIGMSRSGMGGGGAGGMGMRGGGMFGGMGMMGLSTLLSQMDGMNNLSRGEKINRSIYKFFGRKYDPRRNWHVMWMGSTNRPEVLDPALTRSGRLDTKIAVEAPDRASRRLIIQGYLSKIEYDETVDIEAIVSDTSGATPADIAGAITKDAVRIAFFDGRKKVSQKDIDRAFMEQQDGIEMPIEEFDEEQRRVLAYHEAGHALSTYYMAPEEKLLRVTINPLSSGIKGYSQSINTVDQHVTPVARLAYHIVISLAGRAAEKILTGEMYQSVGGDYPAVQYYITLLSLNGFFGPPISGGAEHNNLREKENRRYWLAMEEATERLLRKHWREVVALAEELLIKKTLTGKEIVELIEANQSPDALNEDIIPKTLASIRAQALAEIRNSGNGGMLRQPDTMPPGAIGNNSDEVIIINGGGNGTLVAQAKPADAPKPTTALTAENATGSQQPSSVNTGTPQNNDGPMLINDSGSYEPKLADDANKQ